MAAIGKRPSMGEMMLQHLIVTMICIVFPGSVTWMAPATWLTFDRTADGVRCTARTCVYFVVPYRTQQIDQVTELTKREKAGRTERQKQFGRNTNHNVHVDGEGFLQIHGAAGQVAEVSVSPASLDSVLARCQGFLTATSPSSTTFFAIANWKFGALMGGVLTSLTVLYVVGYGLEFLQMVLRLFKRARITTESP